MGFYARARDTVTLPLNKQALLTIASLMYYKQRRNVSVAFPGLQIMNVTNTRASQKLGCWVNEENMST